MVAKMFVIFILIFFTVIKNNFCYGYICDSPPKLVQLVNGIESEIVSQPSFCYTGYTVTAQTNDHNKNIKIRFTIVPSNFQVQVYDGQIDSGILQNCQIQNGSICFSTGNTVTFYFVPNNAFADYYNNQVKLTVTPYNGSTLSFTFLSLILCFSSFVYQTFF